VHRSEIFPLMSHARFDALLENCVFYISQLYEFSHRLGQNEKPPRSGLGQLSPAADIPDPEVLKQLPGGSEPEYRIKSANEPHERAARESELIKARGFFVRCGHPASSRS